MSDYIERDKIFSVWRSIPAPASSTSLAAAISQTPSADVAPVRHAAKAESADSKTGLICTACYLDIDADAVYCKYCGALMDGKEDEHEAD